MGTSAAFSRGPDAVEAETLAGEVELGFEGDHGRVGIRSGSPMQRAFAFYADELLADLRAVRDA